MLQVEQQVRNSSGCHDPEVRKSEFVRETERFEPRTSTDTSCCGFAAKSSGLCRDALAQCVEVGGVGNHTGTGVRSFEDKVAELAPLAIASDQIADVLMGR